MNEGVVKYSTVSVVCCYTSEEKLKYLTDSLDEQSQPTERILIDNSDGRFSSAAAALNHGASLCTGDLLLFCHQDIRFKSTDSLLDLVKRCAILGEGDVGGVAGAKQGRTFIMITHGEEEEPYSTGSMFDGDYVGVETVDECIIIMPKSTWESHHFDEEICDGWHFYAVEQCLYALLHGHDVYTFLADVNHLSSRGTVNDTYYRALRKLMAAYSDQVSYISTSVGYWPRKGLERAIAYRKCIEWARGIAVKLGLREP